MKRVLFFTKLLLLTTLILSIGACSSDEFNDLNSENPSQSTQHTCKMEFIGNIVNFDQPSSNTIATRETSSSWTNGDKIFIIFYNGSTIVPGEATYNSTSGWSVSYDGILATGTSQKCEARFFVNATLVSSYLVTINPNTEIYEDVAATYSYSNGDLIVQASLKPKTGRIRFTGTSGEKVNTIGITTYAAYALTNNEFVISNEIITSTVAPTGSTSYIYGYFSDAESNICLVGSDFAYTRTCSDDVLKLGESGYMTIPSDTSHQNWRTGAYIKVGYTEIKMIPVVGLSSGFFLMEETEMTESFYDAVNNDYTSTSMYPKNNVTSAEINSFIENLNNITKLSFSLPTSEQWLYAAKGGNKSQGYTYAGSNTPDYVAWYRGNSEKRSEVKTKIPNELGLYDMSGNVGEIVLYGSAYYWCGGGYNSLVSNITASSYFSFNKYAADIGFRLILTCP